MGFWKLRNIDKLKNLKPKQKNDDSVQLWILIGLIILFLIGILVLNSSSILKQVQTGTNETGSKLRNYVSYSIGECSRAEIECTPGYEIFNDKTGCGCEAVNSRIAGNDVTLCTENQKKVTACPTVSNPVCGFKQVECIKAPCYPVPETYGNVCEACADKRTFYYISGECTN